MTREAHELERRCFERSVLPLTAALRRTALHLSRSRADADDLVQETVLRAWRFWPRYTERATCRAWLHRILHNTFVTHCRKRRRERDVLALPSLRAEQENASDALAPLELQGGLDDTLTHGLSALRAEQRRVLLLVDVERRSYKEAAAALGVPIGTVMSRLHRARNALRSQIARAAVRAEASAELSLGYLAAGNAA